MLRVHAHVAPSDKFTLSMLTIMANICYADISILQATNEFLHNKYVS